MSVVDVPRARIPKFPRSAAHILCYLLIFISSSISVLSPSDVWLSAMHMTYIDVDTF